MSIAAIDPGTIHEQSVERKRSFGVDDFAAVMSSSVPAVSTIAAQNAGYQPAAVTSAAISGVAAASQSFGSNAPYYSSPLAQTSTLPGGGYSYGGVPFAGGYAGAAGVGATVPGANPYGTMGSSSIPGQYGAPTQDYLEKQALFQQMNDANWEMLIAQVTVNEISRDYQARSNILKTKSDTELNAVRNMRA